jgi:aspartyl-tRNA(Asn)/glutamyl-tRNA(Gln) amidotransferase subunit A
VELYSLTIAQMSQMISKKEISIFELATSHLQRIKETDQFLDCYITICEDSIKENANKLQSLFNDKNSNPLFGIPMSLKDNICTSGVRTSCASRILEDFIPPYNATVFDKLLNQGSILLGKLNMDEFAMGSSNENSYLKKTKNPWDVKRVPGGSSGASAASVAAYQTPYSLGSDTGGSIRQPASLCGVVGLKPTYGSVSRYGLIAFASSLDQIGPFTRTVEDNAIVFHAICGHDPKDSTSINTEYQNFSSHLNQDIKGIRIGFVKEHLESEGISKDVKESIMSALKTYESLGAIVEETSLPMTEYAIPAYYIISSAEASSNLARYDGLKYGYRTSQFDDLMDLYTQSRSEGFGSEVKRRIMLGTYALSSGYYDAYYKKAMQVRTLIKKEFESALSKYDVIVGPTSPSTAFRFGEKTENPLEMYLMDIYTVAINIAGVPAISIPCGYDQKNLPIGLQIIGKFFDEGKLFQVAHAYEKATEKDKQTPTI